MRRGLRKAGRVGAERDGAERRGDFIRAADERRRLDGPHCGSPPDTARLPA
jgi:hypothetical protein